MSTWVEKFAVLQPVLPRSWCKSASNIKGVSFVGMPVFHANYVGPYYEP